MEEDPVIKKINKRRAKLQRKMDERLRATGHETPEDYRKYKGPVKRWTMVGVHNGMRTPSNNVIFKIYKAIRRFHVSVWFYPFPFIVMIVMFNGAFMNAFNQKHEPEYWEHRFDPTLAIPEHCLLPEADQSNLEELSQTDEIATDANDS